MRFYEVLPGQLFMSGSFKRNPYQIKFSTIQKHRISVVVCTLRTPDPDMYHWATNAPARQYIVEPLSDGREVPVDRYNFVANRVIRQIQSGRIVLVHCIAGRNRSGLVSGLVARQLLKISGEEALAVVRKARPTALVNPVYEQYLRSLPKL